MSDTEKELPDNKVILHSNMAFLSSEAWLIKLTLLHRLFCDVTKKFILNIHFHTRVTWHLIKVDFVTIE